METYNLTHSGQQIDSAVDIVNGGTISVEVDLNITSMWEKGSISASTGAETSSETRLRSVLIKPTSNSVCRPTIKSGTTAYTLYTYCYKENDSGELEYLGTAEGQGRMLSSNTYYVAWSFAKVAEVYPSVTHVRFSGSTDFGGNPQNIVDKMSFPKTIYTSSQSEGINTKIESLASNVAVKQLDILNGKKWAVLGDSFSTGYDYLGTIASGKYAGMYGSYPYLIGNRTNINVISFFGGGRTLAYPSVPGTFANSVSNPSVEYYYQNIPSDVDYITIYLGINDGHHASSSSAGDGEDNTGVIPIGTATDNTTATYYGAWNVILGWLRENRPFAHVGIIVSNAMDDVAYVNATIEMAMKYGYPMLNLNGDDRTPAMIRAINSNLSSAAKEAITRKQSVVYTDPDTTKINRHPNKDAHLLESMFIENFLRSI